MPFTIPVDSSDAAKKTGFTIPANKDTGIASRIGEDLSKRGDEWNRISGEYQSGQIGLPLATLEGAGKVVAGSAGDILGEVGKSIWKSDPNEPIQAAITKGMGKVANSAPVQKTIDAYSNWKKQHPDAANALESTADIAQFLPTGKAIQAVETAGETAAPLIKRSANAIVDKASESGKNISSGVGTLKSGYSARSPEALEGAIKGMENQAGQHFSTMKGVGISPEISTRIFDHIDKAVREEREIDPDLHADYVKTIERMKEKAKAGMTLQQMHLQRQLLRDVETKNFLNNKPVASVARKAIDAMDEALETAKHKGGSQEGAVGVQGMQSGIAKWAQARKFESVANVIQRSQGDPNKLKSGFTTLLNNKKQMRGFTPEEKAAIKAASENSSAEGLMKMMGKFGFDISQARSGGNTLPWLAGFGAHMAGASTPALGGLAAVGTGAKYGQKLAARGKAENVLNAIENRQISPTINTGTPIESVILQIQP